MLQALLSSTCMNGSKVALEDVLGKLFILDTCMYHCIYPRPKPFCMSVRLSHFSVRMHILVMDVQILLSPAEDFVGDIVFALSVHPSSFPPAGRL